MSNQAEYLEYVALRREAGFEDGEQSFDAWLLEQNQETQSPSPIPSLPEGPAEGVSVPSSGALDLIKRVGIWGLAANEGCPCAEFSVHNVSVSISCRKSSGSDVPERPEFYGTVLRVWSNHFDITDVDLKNITDEIVKQLDPWGQEVVVKFTPPSTTG